MRRSTRLSPNAGTAAPCAGTSRYPLPRTVSISRSAAERLERDAQAADVDVDRALLDVDVVAPDLSSSCARLCTRSGRAIRKCSSRNSVGPSATSRPATVTRCVAGSSLSAPAVERFLRRFGRPPPQHRLDPRLQLARGERLGDVVVDPGLEARDLVGLVGARGQHDDRQLARARRRRAAAARAPAPTARAASSRAAPGRAAAA